ncbi:hypothetical protein LA080_009409 [Diaporthe eres]|nr:hypothetical protein LA080_009409 [Diaporthe eres]
MWAKGKRWGVRQGFAPTRLHLERTMEDTWEPSKVPAAAVPTPCCLQHEQRDIALSNTRPGSRGYPKLHPFDPITSWSLNPMPEGAGRRPGRHGGLNRGGMHRTGAHDAVAWAVAEDGEQRRPIGITGVDQDPERGLLAHYRLNVGTPNQVLACFNCAHHHRVAHVAWDEL